MGDAFDLAHLELARVTVEDGALDAALRSAVALSARTLQVERVGIWLMRDANRTLECHMQYVMSRDGLVDEPPLDLALYAAYLEGIETSRTVAADEAQTDPRTRDFATGYLVERGITSMMDAALFRQGKVVGVVCHEHVGPAREWTASERAFAGAVADLVAQLFIQADKAAAEASLREAERKIHATERMTSLGRLAGSVSHDFNNLLAVISVASEAALHEGRTLADRTDALGVIRGAAQEALRLSRQLMAFGQRLDLRTREVDPQRLMADVRPLLLSMLDERYELVIEVDPSCGEVVADPTELGRVLVTLVANAREAMPHGGRLTIRAQRVVEPDGNAMIAFDVEDVGVGMDDATKARVFEPYFSTKPEHVGLGLAAVYGIVQQSNGRIEVSSAPGSGTRVRVLLTKSGKSRQQDAAPGTG